MNITIDEMIEKVKYIEANTQEPLEVTQMIKNVSEVICKAAFDSDKTNLVILSDYDADGICSAYILEHTIKAINPEAVVTTKLNDRREQYGLSPNIQGEDNKRYIILDMGSNQLDFARERLGDDVIIIDHHLIKDEKIRNEFINHSGLCKGLCNPHSLNTDDKKNAQYCTTGLAYRIYETTVKDLILDELFSLYVAQEKQGKKEGVDYLVHDQKLDNTLLAMACIGTTTDMVNVLDENSNNRKIIKEGIKVIDNADEENFDFVIGHILSKCKIEDGVTARQLAFNVGAFLNASSRMSEVIKENGAQAMYDAITSDEKDFKTFKKIEKLMEYNSLRKDLVSELTGDVSYRNFIDEHRYGNKTKDNIGVYLLPDNTPAALAGLIAGKLTEATDKAIICLTYSDSRGAYTGSGRNAESNETSLMDFMSNTLSKSDLEIAFGGHEDAIGISTLKDVDAFIKLVDGNKDYIKQKEDKDMLIISPSEIASPDMLDKLIALEPTGIGLKIPSAVIKGIEQYRDKLFVKSNPDWKTVKVKTDEKDNDGKPVVLEAKDWSYSENSYPQSGKGNKDIAFVVNIGLDNYKGLHTSLLAKFDRGFLLDRYAEIEKQNTKPLLKDN